MCAKYELLKVVVDQLGWRIIVGSNLLEHHLLFSHKLMLRKLGVAHHIRHELKGSPEVLRQKGRVYYGLFLRRVRIQLTAYILKPVGDLIGTTAVRPFEEHMLYQMREAMLPLAFVSRTNPHEYCSICDPRPHLMVQDAKTVS